jgi:xanthine dehydrogenase accessory factor
MNQSHQVIQTAQQLSREGKAYALVTVLKALAPASAKPGDKALVTHTGIVVGWIGGGCAQPAVIKTVRRALIDGCSRVIRISPSDDALERSLDDVLEFGMSCHSGGTLELFVDPVLPQPTLTVIGDTPLSRALAVLAPHVGFSTMVIAHDADASQFPDAQDMIPDDQEIPEAFNSNAQRGYVVVATQGKRDLQGLRAAMAIRAKQVFFVASERKAEVLKRALIEAGEDPAAVRAIIAPAGEPIGAQTPQEIALSVLAAVVALKSNASKRHHSDAQALADINTSSTAPQVASSACSREAPKALPPAQRACCGV